MSSENDVHGKLQKWMRAKWETSETWLPWFLGITAGLVLIGGLAIGFIKSHSREPASFIEISDSETPASEVYSDDSVDSLAPKNSGTFGRGNKVVRMGGNDDAKSRLAFKARKDSPTSGRSDEQGHTFIISLREEVTSAVIEQRTGIPTERGRAVGLVPDALFRRGTKETAMRLELFSDVTPVFKMKLDPQYEVNKGMLSGFAEDDPGSRANFTADDGSVSGFIKYRGRDYRIVADPPRGVHYIIEVRR